MFAVQEDYGSLVNAWEAGVKSDVSTNLFNLSLSAIHVVAFVNRYFYQSLRNAWEEAKKLDKLPKDFAVLIDNVHGDTQASLEERYRKATELWQNMQGWMDEQDIDWVSEGKFKLPGKKK